MRNQKLRQPTGQASLGLQKVNQSGCELVMVRGDLRVDSRILAEVFGNRHRNVMALIHKHAEQFRRFGHLLFETQVGERKQGGGKAERYAQLNEDQAIYLLTLAKNNDRVVPLKAELVAAFRMARDRARIRLTQYMPLYHGAHEIVEALIERARECGSTTPDAIFHCNANKMLNALVGISSGQRESLTVAQQLVLSTLQLRFIDVVQASLDLGDDHRTVMQKAKSACQSYMACFSAHLLSVPPMVPAIRHHGHDGG